MGFSAYRVNCAVCKKYELTSRALTYLKTLTPDKLRCLSAVVRRCCDIRGEWERITEDNYELLASQAPAKNDLPSKVRYLLGYIAHKSRFPGDGVDLLESIDYPICFAANQEEFEFYLKYAKDTGFLEVASSGSSRFGEPSGYRLTPNGWEETSRTRALDSPYVFVAMSLWEKSPTRQLLDKAFEEAICPAVEGAGYEKPIRIDKEDFLGDIVYEIMAQIKKCRFVIADVTDHRHGVYFEGGYAKGMGLPVIWMCHEDHIKDAHFDTRNVNHITWNNDIGKLRERLANRILGSEIGQGPMKKISD